MTSGFDRLFEGTSSDSLDSRHLIGKQVGPYTVIDVIAESLYCGVLLGSDPLLGRSCAVKIVKNGPWFSQQAADRLALEGRILAQLQHPNVVQLYGVHSLEGRPCLVMEYINGGTLQERIKQGPLSVSDATVLLLRIARGVAAAHAKGIIHRDIKPQNILIDSSLTATDLETVYGFVKVTDFGIAKLLDGFESLTLTGQHQPGTMAFMSPEQINGDASLIGPPTDVHAIGILAYLLVAGRHPFEAETAAETYAAILSHVPVPPSAVTAKVPQWFDEFCLRCLEKQPQRRYADAGQVAELLRNHIDVGLKEGEAQRHSASVSIAAAAAPVNAASVPCHDIRAPAERIEPRHVAELDCVRSQRRERRRGQDSFTWLRFAIVFLVIVLCLRSCGVTSLFQ